MTKYTDLRDCNGKRLYIGCEVKVPSLDTLLGKEEKYDIFTLKEEEDLYFEDKKGDKFTVDFVGSSNITLNISKKKYKQKLIELQTQLAEATHLAMYTHMEQVDRSGEPYIYHPLTVMMSIKDTDKIFELKCRIVAILHDVIEDTTDLDMTMEMLYMNVDVELIKCVKLVTKEKGYIEEEYFKRIKEDLIAKTVKIADLTHNMDLSRLKKIKPKDIERYEKYKKQKQYLMN